MTRRFVSGTPLSTAIESEQLITRGERNLLYENASGGLTTRSKELRSITIMPFPSELSQHTELLLLTSAAEKSVEPPCAVRCLDQLNRWLADQNHSEGFWEVSGYAGGNKPMASLVFAATFFDFRFSPFMAYLRELPWQEPERVQLLVREEGMERFATFTKFIE